jgi:hypothetical protein
MRGRVVLAAIVLLCLGGVSSVGASAQREGTFTLSIGGANCDSDPHENTKAICTPAGGVVINVELESGESIGSCTLKISNPPSGGVAAGCGVEGVPFNSTLIISEDPASLLKGYEPINSPQTFVTTDVIPGGGEGPVISFTNVLQAGSDGEPPAIYRMTNLYGGTCDEPDMQNGYYPLSPVVLAQGEPVGQSIAIEAETGYQTVNIPLDTLIDESHVIAVHENLKPNAPIIACGEVGGVNDHDGELVIGLKEMNNSGFTGIARLSYNPADDQKTDVAVYIAKGLTTGQ